MSSIIFSGEHCNKFIERIIVKHTIKMDKAWLNLEI